MVITLSEEEIKKVFESLKSKSDDEGYKGLFKKFSDLNNEIDSPIRFACQYFGEKKLGDKFLDAEKTESYIGPAELIDFISNSSVGSQVLMVGNRYLINGIQEMYEGDHGYFNLLVEGQ